MASFESDEEFDSNNGHHNSNSSPSSPAKLQASGHGYSVKAPTQKKRSSLLRAQLQAQQVLSPVEVKRQNLRSQKIIQPLGGAGNGASGSSEVDVRSQRMKYLRRKKREEQSKKLARITMAKPKAQDIGGQLASLSVDDGESSATVPKKLDARIIFLAKTRAQVALNIATDEVGQKERTNLLVLTVRKILLNARDQPSKRCIKLSNKVAWERVVGYYSGRSILNAAGFHLLETDTKARLDGKGKQIGIYIEPLDVMESKLQRAGRNSCILTVEQNFCLELVTGALDAVNDFLSGTSDAD